MDRLIRLSTALIRPICLTRHPPNCPFVVVLHPAAPAVRGRVTRLGGAWCLRDKEEVECP